MITVKELNSKGFATTPLIDSNLEVTAERLSRLQDATGWALQITSGLRDLADHKRIYLQKAAKEKIANPRIPMGSRHLTGEAGDVADKDNSKKAFLKANLHILEEIGLWCEEGTDGWLHLQTCPPKSGQRFFWP